MTKEGNGLTIGFLGPEGTFTEGAARAYAAAPDFNATGAGKRLADLLPYDDIPELLRAVARGDVDEAVVPVENSIEGTVNATLDTLVHDVDLRIVADIVLPIRHHLLVRPGASLPRIHTVVSHPQALAQCRRWLAQNMPGVRIEAALSTAAAAARVGDRGRTDSKSERSRVRHTPADGHIAAIGNAFSAALYGLDVAAEDIQDESTNATRFFIVGQPEVARAVFHRGDGQQSDGVGPYKTSVAFAFAADGPGNLYGALGEFARCDVNLTKLESRPARQALGHYIFLVDMDGHAGDAMVAAALNAIERECTFLKVLGSYRRIRTSS